jgi:dimethylhistidine N-methyltransferase
MSNTQQNIRFSDYHPPLFDFYGEVISGLQQTPKKISPKFFYDEKGSQLFDEICELPEYYPTRTEMALLQDNAAEIADVIGPDCCLIEPGSGSSQKIRLLLDSIQPTAYMPMDISKQHLLNAAAKLADEYPWLDIHAACADFTAELVIPESAHEVRKVAFFPGSSIGNFDPREAQIFLQHLSTTVGPGGGLLIGVDMKKDPGVLERAYNDAAGVTAAFNLNLLRRINNELDGNFDLDLFRHDAFYNEGKGRIEMHLRSLCEQTVQVRDQVIHFDINESIHTENSYKYTKLEFQWLAAKAGFTLEKSWVDVDGLFGIYFFVV